MNCERKSCGHPLAFHDPCTMPGCGCPGYEPSDRKVRAAMLTDIVEAPGLGDVSKADQKRMIADVRDKEFRRLGGLS